MAVRIMTGTQCKKKKKGVLWLDMILLCGIIALVAGGIMTLVKGMDDYEQMRSMELVWKEIQDIANTPDPTAPKTYLEIPQGSMRNGVILAGLKPVEKPAAAMDEPEPDYLYRPINLNALRERNSDVSGYIYIPNTRVDYPILKESAAGQYYYLRRDINKNYDRYGSIFELSDKERGEPVSESAVNIIFGHNMSSGSMFAGLTNYKNAAYANNPVYIYRDGYRIEYMPYAAMTVNAYDTLYDFDAYRLGTDAYADLIKKAKANSVVRFSQEAPDIYEQTVVLSTCNDAHSDIRFAVFLRETRRALVPEYYETLQEVYEYGGDSEGIPKEPEKPEEPEISEPPAPNYRDEIGDAQGIIIGGRR